MEGGARPAAGRFQVLLAAGPLTAPDRLPAAARGGAGREVEPVAGRARETAAGEFCIPDTALSLDSVMWVQFGVMCRSSSGAGDAQLDVSFSVRRS